MRPARRPMSIVVKVLSRNCQVSRLSHKNQLAKPKKGRRKAALVDQIAVSNYPQPCNSPFQWFVALGWD